MRGVQQKRVVRRVAQGSVAFVPDAVGHGSHEIGSEPS